MNRRRFLTALAGVGGVFAGLIPFPRWRAGASGPAPGWRSSIAGATHPGHDGHGSYDRVISGAVDGFTVPPGEVWKIGKEVESSGNVIVEGTLVMRPGDTLRFVGIDESAFVGGGMEPLDSDVGLWVIGEGILDVEGTPIEPWNRAGTDPTWTDEHEIVLMPWEPGDSGWDPRRNASTVRSYRLGDPVPEIVPGLPTEVVNLSRDVRIEGTPEGRTHIWIQSRRQQKIRYAAIRYVGPHGPGDAHRADPEAQAYPETEEGGHDRGARPRRGPRAAQAARPDRGARPQRADRPNGVHGRYGLHFHMMREASRGTVVEGVVIRDCGNHAFVPHASHGIAFRRCVAFDTFFEQYWWDEKNDAGRPDTSFSQTDDVLYEECIGALAHWGGPGYNGSNFQLGRTRGGAVIGCVAVGCQAWEEGSGFHWPSQANKEPNVWKWKDNLSHNHLKGGVRVWQNTKSIHDVAGLTIYNCGEFGIANGAYVTPGYHWSDFKIMGLGGASYGSRRSLTAGIVLHSVARVGARGGFPDRRDGYAQSFERGLIRDAQVGVKSAGHAVAPGLPTLLKEIAFSEIHDVVLLVDEGPENAGWLDFVDCTRDDRAIRPEDVRISRTTSGFRARFQNGTSAWEMDENGRVTEIKPFYPRLPLL